MVTANRSTLDTIPFSRPSTSAKDIEYATAAIKSGHTGGNGPFSKKCAQLIAQHLDKNPEQIILTHSCTGALEMAMLLIDLKPGDEVIMPSFTFSSTATSVVLRGGIPVFVDIRADTLNLDENLCADAVTTRTKAIVPVDYAGVGCAMDEILEIAQHKELFVVEDAAQGFGASQGGKKLGTRSHLSAFSFHETKNLSSGEGGFLCMNDLRFVERARVLRDKGTNRARFIAGEVDKYTWVDVGSSFLPSDVTAALMMAQIEQMEEIQNSRSKVWQQYYEGLQESEQKGLLRRPYVTNAGDISNHHIFWVLLESADQTHKILRRMRDKGVVATSHYVPLHSSPAGLKFSRTHGQLLQTEKIATRLIRFPLWSDMTVSMVEKVLSVFHNALAEN